MSNTERDTESLAEKLSSALRPGDAVFLRGSLGAGKSVFARAAIRALCGNPDATVPSPTFTLVQTYETDRGPVYHFDLYRIEREDDIYELGWEDALAEGIVFVEWPERLGALAPGDRLEIGFGMDGENGADGRRTVTITPHGRWTERPIDG